MKPVRYSHTLNVGDSSASTLTQAHVTDTIEQNDNCRHSPSALALDFLDPQQQRNSPWSQRALLSHHIGTSRADSDRATPPELFVNYVISDSVIKLSDRLCD
ncbi:hypothetical protein RRG08_040238 [Elysia crispata]|uniref:Uncharacterized protein n=1 Tax=Elysia crispata TaxID=231223 RepID=A0AAE0YHY1_9GAST|nr:hypothetical protein RRG08_040238 [Elysia crispata]